MVVFPTPPFPPTNTVRGFPELADVVSSSIRFWRELRDVDVELCCCGWP